MTLTRAQARTQNALAEMAEAAFEGMTDQQREDAIVLDLMRKPLPVERMRQLASWIDQRADDIERKRRAA